MALMTKSLMLRAAYPSVSQTTQKLRILSGLPLLAGVKRLELMTTGEKKKEFFLEK